MPKRINGHPAYSLVFAFLYMTVIMLIATSAINNLQGKQDYYNSLEDSQMAYLAGQSSAELGILAIKDHYAGYDIANTRTSSDSFCQDVDGDDECEAYGTYEVYGKAQENENGTAGEFYTPIPGTGTAGNPNNCSILDNDKSVNDPCNWNRLLYGQSVTIPLYSDDDSGNRLSPADLGLDAWTLKVRTPCINEEEDPESCERYMLNADDGVIEGEGDSVILWQLIGEDTTGEPITVVPNDEKRVCGFGSSCRDDDSNTEIYESLVNTASDHSVMTSDSAASTEFTFNDLYTNDGDIDVNYLSMQLNIVTKLLDYDGNSIPYLEWQLITESDEPVGDTKSIIIGKGYYEGLKETYYYPFIVTRSTTGESVNIYTLSN